MDDVERYVFLVCQVGAEAAVKAEMAAVWPDWNLAYSRPGFLTFKRAGGPALNEDFDLCSTFARSYGFSLGRLVGDNATQLARQLWQLAAGRHYDVLHSWQRDPCLPGEHGFEPGVSPLAEEVAVAIAGEQPRDPQQAARLRVNRVAAVGQCVLDCVVVEPNEWWFGFHRAAAMPSRYPGGVCLKQRRADVLSRAYWKMAEALVWSQLPVRRRDRCAEIGCAPGGASQALLERGLEVLGIDPGEVDPSLERSPRFRHVKKRAADMKRREFRGVRWLMADANVAPPQVLDTVEAIVSHAEVHVRGLLLTLKLPDWNLARQLPEYVARVRSWGFAYVRTRQLAFHRQEVCLAALRRRSMRRRPPWQVALQKRTAEQRRAASPPVDAH